MREAGFGLVRWKAGLDLAVRQVVLTTLALAAEDPTLLEAAEEEVLHQ